MSGLINYRNYPSGVLPGNTASVNEQTYTQKENGSMTSGNFFFYPARSGYDDGKKQILYETYIIDNQKYNNVAYCNGYFVCKAYGIIKKQQSGKIWELVRYKIVQ